jgi:hypothetical protein
MSQELLIDLLVRLLDLLVAVWIGKATIRELQAFFRPFTTITASPRTAKVQVRVRAAGVILG